MSLKSMLKITAFCFGLLIVGTISSCFMEDHDYNLDKNDKEKEAEIGEENWYSFSEVAHTNETEELR